jgi:glycosyltransferase involved in cell wall biosynthesis
MFLSIVIPCYNEEEAISRTVQELDSIINNAPYVTGEFEVILVIEKCTDNSLQVATELAQKYSFVKVLANDGKYGKGFSVKRGVLSSTGDYVLVTDADLPIDLRKYLTLMFSLINYSSETAAVYATAFWDKIDYRKRKFMRTVASLSLYILRRLVLNQDISDSQLGCKLYKGNPLRHCISHVNVNGFLYEIFITDLIFAMGYKIEECAVRINVFSEKSSVRMRDMFSSVGVFFKYAYVTRKEVYGISYVEEEKIEQKAF